MRGLHCRQLIRFVEPCRLDCRLGRRDSSRGDQHRGKKGQTRAFRLHDVHLRPWHFSRNARDVILFGNFDGSLNIEYHTCAGLRVARLRAANKQRVLPAGDLWITCCTHHAQISRSEMKDRRTRLARCKTNTLKATQRQQWRAVHLGETQIKFRDFIAGQLAGVGDRTSAVSASPALIVPALSFRPLYLKLV